MATDGGAAGQRGDGATGGGGDVPAAGVSLLLTDEQLGLLRREGEVRQVAAGEVRFREGDRSYEFIVILAGSVDIVDHQAGRERKLATGGPGEFVAELNLLTGERLFTTAVVAEAGVVLAVPVARLLAAIGQDQALGLWIIRAMFTRRQWLAERQTGTRPDDAHAGRRCWPAATLRRLAPARCRAGAQSYPDGHWDGSRARQPVTTPADRHRSRPPGGRRSALTGSGVEPPGEEIRHGP